MDLDQAEYYRFTTKQRVEKAINSLMGVLEGIAIDNDISPEELRLLQAWINEYAELKGREPFDELIGRATIFVKEQRLSVEDRQDIIWLCGRFSQADYFGKLTVELQRLHGILGGITADGVITPEELKGLSNWLDEHEHLSKLWPFTEIAALVMAVLKDGKISLPEHETLMSFFANFDPITPVGSDHKALDPARLTIQGVCAVCPDVDFEGRAFCFTGAFKRYLRSDLKQTVLDMGGLVYDSVVNDLDYLVIGSGGNPCWAYACYGRKVEAAMRLRIEKGRPVLLVHEYDFLDAVQDKI